MRSLAHEGNFRNPGFLFAILIAEVDAAAQRAGFAGGAEVVNLIRTAGGLFLGEELLEGNGFRRVD